MLSSMFQTCQQVTTNQGPKCGEPCAAGCRCCQARNKNGVLAILIVVILSQPSIKHELTGNWTCRRLTRSSRWAKTSLKARHRPFKKSVTLSPTAQRHPHSCREWKSVSPNWKSQRLHGCSLALDCSTRIYHLAKKFPAAKDPTQPSASMWISAPKRQCANSENRCLALE